MFVCEINGRQAGVDELAPLAFAGYGHFTSMQVRGYRVVGLDLHLERLRSSAAELFGATPGAERLRALLRKALGAGDGDVSVEVTLFSPDSSRLRTGRSVEPDVLVRTTAPVDWHAPPLRVRTVAFERFLPHIKHVDTLGLTFHPRNAAAEGFDDVLFVTADGRVSEGSIWNIAFQRPDAIVWPDAPALPGITQHLVREGLTRLGVSWRSETIRIEHLDRFAGATFMNSWTPAQPLAGVDLVQFGESDELATRLRCAYEQFEPEEV